MRWRSWELQETNRALETNKDVETDCKHMWVINVEISPSLIFLVSIFVHTHGIVAHKKIMLQVGRNRVGRVTSRVWIVWYWVSHWENFDNLTLFSLPNCFNWYLCGWHSCMSMSNNRNPFKRVLNYQISLPLETLLLSYGKARSICVYISAVSNQRVLAIANHQILIL